MKNNNYASGTMGISVSGGYFHGYYNGTEYPFSVGNNYVANNTPSYKLALGYNTSTKKIEAYVNGTKQSFGDTLPVGTILPYVGSVANIPSGWALCNGSNGTPNLTGRFLEGVTSASAAKISKAAGLPNITGRFIASDDNMHANSAQLGGAFYRPGDNYDNHAGGGGGHEPVLIFDASRCSSIYNNSVTTVQPNSYTVMYIMKIKA